MPTECNPSLFELASIAGRDVVAAFDGGAITTDAGALLLGQADRAIRLTERFASCFSARRAIELVEHQVETLVMQRVEMVAEVLQVMRDLVADGMTMVVVSHEIGFVRSAADRIIFLADGRIIEDRPAQEFLDDPAQPRSRQFLSAILRG
jgi:ABC-type thiamine transport system ATPase subunit